MNHHYSDACKGSSLVTILVMFCVAFLVGGGVAYYVTQEKNNTLSSADQALESDTATENVASSTIVKPATNGNIVDEKKISTLKEKTVVKEEVPELVKILTPNGKEEYTPKLSSILWEFDSSLEGCNFVASLISENGTAQSVGTNKLFAYGKSGMIKTDVLFGAPSVMGSYKAKVEVTCPVTHAKKGVYSDSSDAWFTYKSDSVATAEKNINDNESVVKIITPNGGDISSSKNSLQVEWRTGTDVAMCPVSVSIVGGTVKEKLEEVSMVTVNAESGPYKVSKGTYTIPTKLFSKDTYYRVQVDHQCVGDVTIFRDQSDEAIRLLTPTVTVLPISITAQKKGGGTTIKAGEQLEFSISKNGLENITKISHTVKVYLVSSKGISTEVYSSSYFTGDTSVIPVFPYYAGIQCSESDPIYDYMRSQSEEFEDATYSELKPICASVSKLRYETGVYTFNAKIISSTGVMLAEGNSGTVTIVK